MKRSVLLLAGAVVGLTACDGFREAMTAHVDVAARAGAQELSVTQLAQLLGEAQVPLNKEVAKAVAQVWVNYQLLGTAAAKGDSLDDARVVESAMWSQYANIRAGRFLEEVGKSWAVEPGPATEADYIQGEALAARHVLIRFPGQPGEPVSDAARDSVRQIAEGIRTQITPANFAEMARRHSNDPGSAQQGGDLGLFPRGMMVPEFERALVSLQPGEISPVVQTDFGYHVIMRSPFGDVNQEQLAQAVAQRRAFQAESSYYAALETTAKVNVKANVAKRVKEIAEDPDAHRRDRTVLATYDKGEFTGARFAQWLQASPPQNRMREQILSAPDSMLPQAVRQFVRYDLILQQADSAQVQVDSTEAGEIRRAFVSAITSAWSGLGIRPEALADSAQTENERARLAGARVDGYFARLVRNESAFIQVPGPVEAALRERYDYRVNDAGIDRALDLAARVRARADSVRAAQQPPTAVPMPGAVAPEQPQPGQAPPNGR